MLDLARARGRGLRGRAGAPARRALRASSRRSSAPARSSGPSATTSRSARRAAKWTVRVDARRLRGPARQARGRRGRLRAQDEPGDLHEDRPRGVHAEPCDFMSGVVKSNDIALLLTFQKVFQLDQPVVSIMRYLVTGATGFLGAHLARALECARPRGRALRRGRLGGDVLDGAPRPRGRGGLARAPSTARARCRASPRTPRSSTACTSRGRRPCSTRARRPASRASSSRPRAARSPSARRAERVATEGDAPPIALLARWPYYRSKLFAERAALERNGPRVEVVCVNPTLLLGPGDVHGSSTEDVRLFLERRDPAVPAGRPLVRRRARRGRGDVPRDGARTPGAALPRRARAT